VDYHWPRVVVDSISGGGQRCFSGCRCQMISSAAGSGLFCWRRAATCSGWFWQCAVDYVGGRRQCIVDYFRLRTAVDSISGSGRQCIFQLQALDDFVGSGWRLVLAAMGSGKRRLVSARSGGLGWRQATVCSGLSSAADSGRFHWAAGSLLFLLIRCVTNTTLKLILIIIFL